LFRCRIERKYILFLNLSLLASLNTAISFFINSLTGSYCRKFYLRAKRQPRPNHRNRGIEKIETALRKETRWNQRYLRIWKIIVKRLAWALITLPGCCSRLTQIILQFIIGSAACLSRFRFFGGFVPDVFSPGRFFFFFYLGSFFGCLWLSSLWDYESSRLITL